MICQVAEILDDEKLNSLNMLKVDVWHGITDSFCFSESKFPGFGIGKVGRALGVKNVHNIHCLLRWGNLWTSTAKRNKYGQLHKNLATNST